MARTLISGRLRLERETQRAWLDDDPVVPSNKAFGVLAHLMSRPWAPSCGHSPSHQPNHARADCHQGEPPRDNRAAHHRRRGQIGPFRRTRPTGHPGGGRSRPGWVHGAEWRGENIRWWSRAHHPSIPSTERTMSYATGAGFHRALEDRARWSASLRRLSDEGYELLRASRRRTILAANASGVPARAQTPSAGQVTSAIAQLC